MNNSIIEIRDAVVSYREDVALKGVSISVKHGDFIGVVGPNGAGKTTLLTLVNGLARLWAGQVQVLGKKFNRKNCHYLRRKVGYVPQAEQIDPRMPMMVREVAMIGRYGLLGLFRRPNASDWEIVDTMLEQVGMNHLARRPIGHLSGGEQQRVAIARCLAQQPEIFLLDEPTASLDFRAKTEILEMVWEIHRKYHLTTLLVTHDLNALPSGCNRIVLMKDGLIWKEGTPGDMLSSENLSELYGLPLRAVQQRRAAEINQPER